MTRAWQTLAAVTTDEGRLELRRRGDQDFLIILDGRVLMTSSNRRSEEALATRALPLLAAPAPRVLIGGLGMGFTLRAALDGLPADARVVVAELNAPVAMWCRGPLAAINARALDDPRVGIEIGDVARSIRAARPGAYHAILLDLYEGPHDAIQGPDDPFYGPAALARAHAALAAGGVLAVWSEEAEPAFARRLGAAGFAVTAHREGRGGRAHLVYVGRRGSSATT